MADSFEGARRPRSDAVFDHAHIVEVAKALLTSRPRATMAEVAVASHVSRGTLYRQCATRGDLLRAVNRSSHDSALGSLSEGLRPPGELLPPVKPLTPSPHSWGR